MTYSIVYSNPNGNTKLLADVVYNNLDKVKVAYFGPTSDEALAADIIFVGFWTLMNTCDDLTKQFLQKLTYQRVVLFGSAGFGLSQEYFNQVLSAAKENISPDVEIIDTFMCQGRMKMSVREKYLKQKEESPNNSKIDIMIKNFDLALKHPDSDDLLNLANKVVEIKQKYN